MAAPRSAAADSLTEAQSAAMAAHEQRIPLTSMASLDELDPERMRLDAMPALRRLGMREDIGRPPRVVLLAGQRLCGVAAVFNEPSRARARARLGLVLFHSISGEIVCERMFDHSVADRMAHLIFADTWRQRDAEGTMWATLTTFDAALSERHRTVVFVAENWTTRRTELAAFAYDQGGASARPRWHLTRESDGLRLPHRDRNFYHAMQAHIVALDPSDRLLLVYANRPLVVYEYSLADGTDETRHHYLADDPVFADDRTLELEDLFAQPYRDTSVALGSFVRDAPVVGGVHDAQYFVAPLSAPLALDDRPLRPGVLPHQETMLIVIDRWGGRWTQILVESELEYVNMMPGAQMRLHIQIDEDHEAQSMRYVPDTDRLALLLEREVAVIELVALARVRSIEYYVPQQMAAAPRALINTVRTVVLMRAMAEVSTPWAVMPNELLFEIFKYL